MNKCKDCIYFKPIKEKYPDIDRKNKYGDCKCNKFIYDVYSSDEERERMGKGDCFLYEDAEGYSAWFVVGEDFGCIHFKKGEIK